tara:strand:+ start:9271 stop:11205 length:1935 start_codon:yes stop_codon:yes gene_type:complete
MAQSSATQNYRSANYQSGPNEGMICDLSEHAEKLVAYEDISSLLTEDQERKIVDYVKSMMDMSYHKISKRYDHWKEADRAHDVYVPPEATEYREKAVIADTRAIADTVLTYMMAALSGRNPMFQLEGMNRKSRQSSMILERVLHQQMRRTAGEARLAQMLLDSIRYGFAPTKIVWDAKANQNKIVNFDPRRVFPDPRVNWGDWDNMQYIVFSDYVSYNSLLYSGLYPKLKQFPALRHKLTPPKNAWNAHHWHKEEGRGLSIDPAQPNQRERNDHSYFTLGDARVVDETWVRLSGHEIGIPSIEQIYLVLTILDENVVIRMQLNPYGQQFPIAIGGLYQDTHKTYGQSLYDLLLPMHDIATYLLRSRIDNVSAALNNLIFVDPTQVSVPDLIDRNPWGVVRTLPGTKPGDGVFIAQVPDVTRGHFNDIAAMGELKQRVSAASDAQQGMPTSDGIRTATEIQRLTQLGSQRLGVISRVMSATTIRPMVRMMVNNIQDALTMEGSIKIDPTNMPTQLSSVVDDGYLDYEVSKDLQGDIDYLVIDGTLPLEPTRNAETWMNMLQIMQQTGLNMEYDAGQIAEEAIRAMGITDMDRFRISEQELQAKGASPSQQISMMEKMRGANVQSQQDIQNQVQKGNLVPMKQARR